jgi:hypothetical protein
VTPALGVELVAEGAIQPGGVDVQAAYRRRVEDECRRGDEVVAVDLRRFRKPLVARGQALGTRDERRIAGHAAIRLTERIVGPARLRRFEHSRRAAAQQIGAIRSLHPGESIQPLDGLVGELHQHLPAAHGHMARLMVWAPVNR